MADKKGVSEIDLRLYYKSDSYKIMNKFENLKNIKRYEYSKIVGIENIEFGKNIIIDDFVFIYAAGKIKIGNFVHIACFTSIAGGEYIEIGDFCALSHGSRILSATDDFKSWGFGNSTISGKFRNTKRLPIKIGNFVIIGANSVVLPGVVIGEGATVGACSVVTKNLEPWGVYIGNKKIGERDRDGVLKNFANFEKSSK